MKDFQYPDDIYTEAETDPNTLANLGPLARLAGVWEGKRGVDINPKAEGPEKDPYIERYEAHPTDASNQWSATLLWITLSHPYCTTRRSGNVPRPSGLLVMGT